MSRLFRNLTLFGSGFMLSACAAEIATPEEAQAVAEALQAGPAQASAASNCRWNSSESRYYCSNRYNAPVYYGPNASFDIVDAMYTTWSWFICKDDHGGPNGERQPHPRRWLLTRGDRTGRLGYMRDVDISSETDPVPDCPTESD